MLTRRLHQRFVYVAKIKLMQHSFSVAHSSFVPFAKLDIAFRKLENNEIFNTISAACIYLLNK